MNTAKEDDQLIGRVRALADKWHNATDASTGYPSIVARAFAADLYAAINGD